MDNQELQNSAAKIAQTLITPPMKSPHGFPVLVGGKVPIRELHPDFEEMYLNHFAEPEHAFDAMRDNLFRPGV
jgi:hypothetical protein